MNDFLGLILLILSTTHLNAVWGQKDVTLQADSQSVAEGENVRLRCIYETEAPIYTTKWHKDDQEFMRYVSDVEPSLLTFPLHVEIEILNHTTVILKNVTSSSTGNYSCEVIIEAPFVVASATTEIVVAESKIQNGIEIKVVPTVIRTNDNVKLLCNHTLSDQVTVKWYRHIDDFLLVLIKSNEVSLLNVKPEMSGEYTCEVTTDEPSHLELRSTKYISIKDPVVFSAVTLDMEPSEPKVGDTIRLRCNFDADNETPYLIKWYKDSYLFYQQRHSLKTSKRKLNNKTLKINLKLSDLQEIVLDDVTTEASGTYTCQVNTYNYGNAASRNVSVTNPETLGSDTISVASRSLIRDYEINKENVRIDVEPAVIKTGDKVRLRCDFSSLQEPIHSLIWYKDNKEFYKYIPSQQEKLNLINEHEIFLLNAKPEKSGNYECEVLIDAPLFHKFRTTKYLSMEDSNKTLVNIEPLTPNVGGKLLLKCNYDFHNESLYVVQWYKDSILFYQYISGSRSSKLSFFLNSSKINLEASNHQQVVLENLTAEASGTYMCQINTLLLVEQFSTQVQVEEPIVCTYGYFQCGNLICISINWKCDGTNDCMDGSDEDIKLCGIQTRCDSGFFKCGYSNCIPIEWKCDGDRDCVDGVDEFPRICNKPSNKCNSSQFTCGDSKCIPITWKCDGEKDCTDGSDEDSKLCKEPSTCSSDQFTCGDSKCVTMRWKCDGEKDCADGSDEDPKVCGKPHTCSSDQFTCSDSRCVPMRWKCDGNKDCYDGSDEDPKECGKPSTCSSDQFTCGDSKCLSLRWKCDGEKDCTDGSDEDPKVCGKPRTCSSDQFTCGDSKCLSMRWKCDGEKDCTDGSDEDPKVCGKPSTCSSDQFTCGDSKCVPMRWKCDGEKDCADGSDEDPKECGKPSTCSSDQFTCGDSKCVPMRWKCNGEKDCTDGSDEDPKVCGKPSTCSSFQFTCGDLKCVPMWWKCDGEKDCGDGSDEDPKLCSSSTTTEKPTCGLQYFQCSDSRCVPIESKCDGKKDCYDGLDEDPKECESRKCGSYYYQCFNTRCIPITWLCDGENDCGDKSDERPRECGYSNIIKNIEMYVKPTEIISGDKVTLYCNFTLIQNEPIFSVKWYKDNEEFYRYTPSDRPIKKVFQLPNFKIDWELSNDHEIVLLDVIPEMSGNYTCEALTDAPPFIALQTTQYVSIIDKTSNITVSVEPAEPKVGDTIWLKCNYDLKNETSYVVKWYKDSRLFYQYVSGSEPKKTKLTLNSSTTDLEASNHQEVVLENATAEASGTYTCVVSTFYSDERASRKLSVQRLKTLPSIVLTPSSPRRGDKLSLECNYDLNGQPLYTVKWYKGVIEFYRYVPSVQPHVRVFSLRYLDSNVDLESSNEHRLVILNARPEMSGNYSCEVTTDAPMFHTMYVTKYISIKDFIPCKVKEFRCGNSRCIPTIQLCNGENDCGDESDEDPKECADSRGLDEIGLDVPASVNVNETVTLQCNYDLKGQSPYIVKWYKDGQEFYRYTLNRVPQGLLTQSRGFKLNFSTSNNHQVVLEHVQEKASGNYSCKVKSLFSTKMATAMLNVTTPVT